MKKCLYLAIAIGVTSWTYAQIYTPPAQRDSRDSREDSSPNSQKKQQKGVFGEEVPLLDPSDETITIGGMKIPLGDTRVIKARFEKYLNEPEEKGLEAREYRTTIDEILALLSPHRYTDGKPDMKTAFRLLPRAATYQGDARISSSLAEAIYTALLAKQDTNNLRKLNEALQEEQKLTANEADWIADKERGSQVSARRTLGKKGTKTDDELKIKTGKGVQSVRFAERLKRITEIEALRKSNIARTEVAVAQSKATYQFNLVNWFMARRFQHVLMGSRFYNQIWRDGDSQLRIKKDSDVSKLFTESLGTNPTVALLDTLSSEAIADSKKAIEAFNFLLSQGEIHTASKRLMEAFAVGEYTTPVATLPRSKKRQVQGHIRNLSHLYDAMQARDYGTAREIIAKIKKTTTDFPGAKAEAAVAGYTIASDLAVEEAKAMLYAKNSKGAAEKIKEATLTWPTNPKIEEFRALIGQSGPLVQARNDFDRLLREGNYREIFKRQHELAPAIKGDTGREDALRQIIQNVGKIEVALAKADEFTKVGNSYAAWEQLALLRKDFPDDPKLGRQLEILAPKVADFTKALDRAEELSSRKQVQVGSALAWYLKARQIYPQSELAQNGVSRLVEVMMQLSN